MKMMPNASEWKSDIAPYALPSRSRSSLQFIGNIIPYLLIVAAAYFSYSISLWISVALSIAATAFLVRIFIMFHDCSHHAFFRSRRANTVFGVITGLLTFFPYYRWKNEHWIHHATSGNLSRRGTGDIWTLTVEEYQSRSKWQQRFYRLYRNPFVMFGLGPLQLYLVEYRYNTKGARPKERWNTHLTTAALALIVATLCYFFGWKEVLIIQGTMLYLAGMIGIWLFYVQHQFEDTYFEKDEEWEYVNAALEGSSFYKLPRVLQWVTGNIGYHHIHHLSPRIPNYYLEKAAKTCPSLQNVPSVTLATSLKSLNFRLWDESQKQFVGFRKVHHSIRLARRARRIQKA